MKWLDFALAAAVAASLAYAPYTKVEESFFMQAVHDILKWGRINSQFDHLSFPGVVPRSFIGPLFISALSYSAKINNDGHAEGINVQTATRLVLGLLVVWANSRLRQEVGRIFGPRAATWYGWFCLTQFHFTFWTSRMLGNTLALVPMLDAQKYWLRCSFATSAGAAERSFCSMAVILVFTAVVLRFDTVVFAMPMLASCITNATRRTIKTVLFAFVVSAVFTLLVDSYYWQQKWMWPELRVFWFNVVRGQSVEWGVAPGHHYFTHSIPRLLLGALPFACVGACVDSRGMRLAAAYLAAVAVFSANAHKEWRFILPAVPVFNVCAALGVARLARVARFRRVRQVVLLCAAAMTVLSAAATVGMTYVSGCNYPGGQALALLHTMEPATSDVRVHIDVYAAMTGVSRFGQLRPHWTYDKTEGLVEPEQFANYTHLLTSEPEIHAKHGFEVIAVQNGYAGLDVVPLRQVPSTLLAGKLPASIRQKPLVWIMKHEKL
ncbi:alpha-1,6- mannosyltransferase [Coemansia erecta]|nr:alpha-1,6- mannosyltransferase [Coemansia erecta]